MRPPRADAPRLLAREPAPARALDLSVVLPVHDESANIPPLHERLSAVLRALDVTYELIFVDDGSRDGSAALVEQLAANDPHVVLVQLARNFGHQRAVTAGLDHASGRGVVVMDADLQDPPEVLPELVGKWREGYDVVYAVRDSRQEGLVKRAAYWAFYRLLMQVADISIPLDAGDFCLMDRCVVDALATLPERTRFVRGIRSWVGFRQLGVRYDRPARHAGRAKYTISRLVYLALDGLISFSYMPLRLIVCIGFLISAISLAMAAVYAVRKLAGDLNPPGFATLVVAIFFLAGVQLVTLGVVGEYIGRIFEEVKQRPLYVVRRVLRPGA